MFNHVAFFCNVVVDFNKDADPWKRHHDVDESESAVFCCLKQVMLCLVLALNLKLKYFKVGIGTLNYVGVIGGIF